VLRCTVRQPKKGVVLSPNVEDGEPRRSYLTDHEGDFKAEIDLQTAPQSGIREGACGSLMIVANLQFQLVGRTRAFAQWGEPAVLAASALRPNSAAIPPMPAAYSPVRDDETPQEAAGAGILPLRIASTLVYACRRSSWLRIYAGLFLNPEL
jgi:hypothetical protein